jgi:hypothetical protein
MDELKQRTQRLPGPSGVAIPFFIAGLVIGGCWTACAFIESGLRSVYGGPDGQ